MAAAQGESDPLAAGARFGSLAVSLAGQMAARLQADAERRASRIDAEAIAREEEAARQREDEEEAARLRKEEDSRQREEERLLFAARLKRIKEAEEAEAALGREVAFRKMLAELLEPAITGASIWPVVKRRVWADPRFAAVAPECRERLFNEYIEVGSLLTRVGGWKSCQSRTWGGTELGRREAAQELEFLRLG